MAGEGHIPETRYVEVGDADVAYQVVGDGPTDLLFCRGLGSHLLLQWEVPVWSEFLSRLASFSRLIMFDRRGTGLSDPVPRRGVPTWEEWSEDIGAVLDAVGCPTAAVFAQLEAGTLAMQFGATHPERVSALVLANTTARFTSAENYPQGVAPQIVDDLVEFIADAWGTRSLLGFIAGADADRDEDFVRRWTLQIASSATPRAAAAQWQYVMETVDVRAALGFIQAPTLVIHYEGNPVVPIAQGRYLADRIPDARLLEVPGEFVGFNPVEMEPYLDEIAEFVTGARPTPMVDRVLTTVLFTDIVQSTEQLAARGDQAWKALLDSHDRVVRVALQRFRGREVNTTGDGFVASFDGPARAIRCAQAIIDATHALGIDVRAGLHTGECEIRGNDLAGLAVHIAARVAALAGPQEILVSRTVTDLVAGSGIEFMSRGEHELKGVPGAWRLFVVEGLLPAAGQSLSRF